MYAVGSRKQAYCIQENKGYGVTQVQSMELYIHKVTKDTLFNYLNLHLIVLTGILE